MTYCPTNTEVEVAKGVAIPLSTYYSMLFNSKIKQGIYHTEEVSCFCGASNYKTITNYDRYGNEYTLCLCVECGLLYANPRMTEDTLKKFYKEDYRNMYGDRVEIGGNSEVIGDAIYEQFSEFDYPLPKVIFDIGCGQGDLLDYFQKKIPDCYTYGVDYDENVVEFAKNKGRNVQCGGIEILEQSGKKADLIIMFHVLEHFTHLERDLKRIRELLSDNGLLYIAVPGFYNWDRASLFQNAHNYQFNGRTLEYVMRCCGFDSVVLTENIDSLWFKSDSKEKTSKNPDEARYVEGFLMADGNKFVMPPVRVNCKFPLKKRKKNIDYAMKQGVKQITELIDIHPDSDAIIIGGGPSVGGYVEKIKELKSKGARVYAIERMYKWCLDRDIVPDYIIVMDACDDVIDSFTEIHPDTTHIVFAQCNPDVFDLLKDKKLYYFFALMKGIDYAELCRENNIKRVIMVNPGGSVTLGAISIAITLGARNFHIFGFDCHITNGNYAQGITGVGNIDGIIDLEIDGRIFTTTAVYAAFMQQFFDLYLIAKNQGQIKDVKIYGDSMIKAASRIDIDGDKVTD